MEYKGYVGERKIEGTLKAPGKSGALLFVFKDGSSVKMSEKMAKHAVTDKPVTESELRDLRMHPVVVDILTMLLEYGVKMNELDYMNASVKASIQESFGKAEEMMWGTDEKTTIDIQDVLDGTKKTLNDVLKGAGDK